MIKTVIRKLSRAELLRHAGLYTGFNVLDRLVPFLVLPILSRKLSVEEIGFYILYLSVFNLVRPIITVNADSGIMLNHYHLDKEKFKSYFSSGVVVFSIAFLIASLSTYLFSPIISRVLETSSEILYLAYIEALFYFFNRLILNIWRREKKPINYGVFTILLTLTKNAFILLFIYKASEQNWTGVVIAQIIGQFLFFIYSVLYFFRHGLLNLEISKKNMKDVFNLGFPLSIHQVGTWGGNAGLRLLVKIMVGAAATGLFGIGSTFGMAIAIIQESFNQAYIPFLYEKLKDLDTEKNKGIALLKKKKLVNMTYFYNILLLIVAVFVSIVGYFTIGYIFGENYIQAREYVTWIVFAYAFNGMYKMHVNYMFYYKKTKPIASMTTTIGVFNILLAIVLIKLNNYDAIGAAQSLLISQLMLYLVCWYKSNKIYPMPWLRLNLRGIYG